MNNNSKIDCLEWHIDFHNTHANAGWSEISNDHIENRFIFYYRWLAKHKLITVPEESISNKLEMYMDMLTPEGHKFLAMVHDKFVSLDKPERTLKQDELYLLKRYKAVVQNENK